jgi:hypothetical protein
MIDSTQPSMLEIHSQAIQNVDTAYHEFLLIYRKDELCVYGFVEGKDDPCFYRHLVEKELPEKWSIKLIQSGSRNKVLRSYQSFDWSNYNSKRICFFVDRDMHDFLNTQTDARSNIYVTDGYSIENSILGDKLLNSVLSDVYQINLLHPDDETKIKQIVRVNEDVFFEAILPLMGQIMLWRRSGSIANLNNLKLDSFFSFDEAICQVSEQIVLLAESAKQIGCERCDDADILAAVQEIRVHNRSRMMIRGKYALWFFLKQCEAIGESIHKLSPKIPSPPKKRIEYGMKNAIVIIGPRVHAPESLKDFIRHNYLLFITENRYHAKP